MSSRCYICRRKVGLSGFECVCGNTFCSEHRYAFTHNCRIDRRKQECSRLEKIIIPVYMPKVEKL